MFTSASRRPSHRLVVVFVLATLLPSMLLVAFGWRMLYQERVLHQSELATRRVQVAELVVSALEGGLSDAERLLRSGPDTRAILAEGAVFVTVEPGGVRTWPLGRVLHVPVAPRLRQARADAFTSLDFAEYQLRDPSLSAKLASELAGSADPAIRATALIRLARVLRGRGQHDAALRVYEQAAKTRDAAIEGVPADLFARWAAVRCWPI